MVHLRSKASFEVVFKSPAPKPNGMTSSPEGVWLIDQHMDDAYLVDDDGVTRRRIMTDSGNSSGLAYGGGYLWIGLNGGLRGRAPRPNDRTGFWILKASPKTGKTLEAFQLPDEGRLHGLEWVSGRIWAARHEVKLLWLYDPKTWAVENEISLGWSRTHGLAWDGDGLWAAFTTDKIIAKYDVKSGKQVDEIQLPETSPDPHGLAMHKGSLLYSDANSAEVARVVR